MKEFVLAACLLASTAVVAVADDFSEAAPNSAAVASVYNWTGLYAGGSAGGQWQHEPTTFRGDPAELSSVQSGYNVAEARIMSGQFPRSLDQHGTGFIGGALAGYNFHTGVFVYGVEADISGMNAHAGASTMGITPVLVQPDSDNDGNQHHMVRYVACPRGRAHHAINARLRHRRSGGCRIIKYDQCDLFAGSSHNNYCLWLGRKFNQGGSGLDCRWRPRAGYRPEMDSQDRVSLLRSWISNVCNDQPLFRIKRV